MISVPFLPIKSNLAADIPKALQLKSYKEGRKRAWELCFERKNEGISTAFS